MAMISFGALGFVAPFALAGLLVLPVIWWLIRVTPPAPRRVVFPPIRFLLNLRTTDETADRTPPWLLLLRLLIAALIILGVARPVYVADPLPATDDPLLLIVDDGWAAAGQWSGIKSAAAQALDRAERQDRPVILVTTSAAPPDRPAPPPRPMTANQARDALAAMRPKPWAVDRDRALADLRDRLAQVGIAAAEIVWLTDGLRGGAAAPDASALLDTHLRGLGPLSVVRPESVDLPVTLDAAPGSGGAEGLQLTARRADDQGVRTVQLRFADDAGLPVATRSVTFEPGADAVDVAVDLPSEWLNRVERVDIVEERTAAATLLLDSRWRRRPVGLVGGTAFDADQPLLSPYYYLQRALEPVAELRPGDVDALLSRALSVMITADIGAFDAVRAEAIRRWVEQGGMLIRFAGVRLAESGGADGLTPAPVRQGVRDIGGTFAWRGSGRLDEFAAESPFAGLRIPEDVIVRRQLLIEPREGDGVASWAQLDDGTPLVSARRAGEGWIVLFHASANAEWSNLALSGLFVDMLERLVALSKGVEGAAGQATLSPKRVLDGFGALTTPASEARPLTAQALEATRPGPEHPPGFYSDGKLTLALNLAAAELSLTRLGRLPDFVTEKAYGLPADWEARPWLFTAAAVLLLADLALSLFLRGLIPGVAAGARRPAKVAALILIVGVAMATPPPAVADGEDAAIPPAVLSTRLAYVVTGDAQTDAVVRAGLEGLGVIINLRTALELEAPIGVDPATNELAFYPLIYWAVDGGASALSPAESRNLATYMRNGGTIVFDVRARGGADRADLRRIAASLDLPPLIPLPTEHVLRRSYYLLSDTPGRWTGNTVWIERTSEHVNDGVTTVIAGNHDWVGAWAVDEARRPLLAVVPGGEEQREIAYRFGVNLVMHALTGSYKADQVHMPTILERLGL